MAAAIEHPCAIRQDPIVDVFHVLAGEEKNNHDRESNYQMKPFHRVVSCASNFSYRFRPELAYTAISHNARI